MTHEKHHEEAKPAKKAKAKQQAASEATLRDMFAMHSLGPVAAHGDDLHALMAKAAYARADAMLAAREEHEDAEEK